MLPTTYWLVVHVIGILCGRDLLKTGVVHVIVSGNNTSVWRDNWLDIIRNQLLKPESHEWDEAAVRDLFPLLWEKILQIKSSSTGA